MYSVMQCYQTSKVIKQIRKKNPMNSVKKKKTHQLYVHF